MVAGAALVRVGYTRWWRMATAVASARVRHARLIVLIAICLSWSSVAAEDYAYPYHDPYVATITAAILNGDAFAPRLKRQVIHVPGLRGRNQLPSLEGRGDLSVALHRQRHPAPLLFVLSGVGSNPYFGLATYFAGLFHREGFHVVILPSPMSWNFALAASRSGAPGYAPADARDRWPQAETANPAVTRFIAEAEAWQSHFETASTIMQAVAAAYPSDETFAGRAG